MASDIGLLQESGVLLRFFAILIFMENFWSQLKKPFFVLAPMDDVTDVVFRRVVAEVAAPEVFFTEFTSTDGFCSPGRERVSRKLVLHPSEKTVVAQLWGTNPEHFYKTVEAIREQGFAGIDINMGCPEKTIVRSGACSALIDTPKLAAEIIQACKSAAGDLPVSVKTRIGTRKIITEEWISFVLKQKVAALTVHGRTAKEMSKVPAHWDEIKKTVELRNKIAPETILIGNGDVQNREDGLRLVKESGVDGIMIGRGIFQDPLAFQFERAELSIGERMNLLRRHIELYEETWQGEKSYEPLKKFVKMYINGFPGAAEMRAKFMETKNPAEALNILDELQAAAV